MGIVIVNFSGRSGGNCHDIAVAIWRSVAHGHEAVLVEMSVADISPCGKCDCQCFDRHGECPFIKDEIFGIYGAVCAAEKAFYIVPNYCDYPCANFFIFNERGQCFFQNRPDMLERYSRVTKKFVVVSNTGRDNFVRAFMYHVGQGIEPDILFLAAKDYGKISVRGGLMGSPQCRLAVQNFVG